MHPLAKKLTMLLACLGMSLSAFPFKEISAECQRLHPHGSCTSECDKHAVAVKSDLPACCQKEQATKTQILKKHECKCSIKAGPTEPVKTPDSLGAQTADTVAILPEEVVEHSTLACIPTVEATVADTRGPPTVDPFCHGLRAPPLRSA